MGKASKRSKDVSLTKVKPKGKALKYKLIEKAHDLMEAFPVVFVFHYTNFKTFPFQVLRESLPSSKILLGKAKVLQKAMGLVAEEESFPSSSCLSAQLKGNCGLLFTKQPPSEMIEYFDAWRESTFLNTGQTATEDITIPAGIGTFTKLSSTAEPHLRKIGLPTKVTDGAIEVLADYEVCKTGQTLKPEQAKILRLIDAKQGEMRVSLKGYLTNGKYTSLN